MKQTFYICHHCGNIVAMIRDQGVPIVCCGEKMEPILPGKTEASTEKHLPMYEIRDQLVFVTVGSAEHPMTKDHFIEWICLETEQGIQYAYLEPEDAPKAQFALCPGDRVRAVYAFCNQHDLWRN